MRGGGSHQARVLLGWPGLHTLRRLREAARRGGPLGWQRQAPRQTARSRSAQQRRAGPRSLDELAEQVPAAIGVQHGKPLLVRLFVTPLHGLAPRIQVPAVLLRQQPAGARRGAGGDKGADTNVWRCATSLSVSRLGSADDGHTGASRARAEQAWAWFSGRGPSCSQPPRPPAPCHTTHLLNCTKVLSCRRIGKAICGRCGSRSCGSGPDPGPAGRQAHEASCSAQARDCACRAWAGLRPVAQKARLQHA